MSTLLIHCFVSPTSIL